VSGVYSVMAPDQCKPCADPSESFLDEGLALPIWTGAVTFPRQYGTGCSANRQELLGPPGSPLTPLSDGRIIRHPFPRGAIP
jgi:hypothetical protein